MRSTSCICRIIQEQVSQVQSLLGGSKTDCGQSSFNILAFTEANSG